MKTLQAMLVRVAAAILRPRSRVPGAPIHKVLVIRIDERVGNVLLTTPLLAALRTHVEIEVHVLVAASKARLIDGRAHRIIPFQKRDFFRHPIRFWRALQNLSAERYDAVIDASHWHELSGTSALLLAWTRAPIRVAHARGSVSSVASVAIPPPTVEEHDSKTKLRLLPPLGLEGGWTLPSTGLGESGEARSRATAWLGGHGEGGDWVGLVPGARKPDHRAPPELYAEIARAATARGHRVVVLWGPGEEALAEAVCRESAAVMAPPTDLEALSAFMRECALLVTNDTGPMHLAVSVGCPTVGLFIKEDALRWGYPDPPHAVVTIEGKPASAVVDEVMSAVGRLEGCVGPSS